jgi:hypothetical protein
MAKKGDTQMMWIIIGAVLAITVMVVYSFMTGGIVKKFMASIFKVSDDSDQRLECTVLPWEGGDSNGDGIRDDSPDCARFVGNQDAG